MKTAPPKFLTRFVLLSALLMAFGCKREEPTRWNNEMLVPLVKGSLSLNQLVADSLLQADENSLWHLKISRNLTDFELDSLVQIPDTVIRKSFKVPLLGGPFSLPPNTTLVTQNENYNLGINQVQLKEVLMKSGTLEYSIKSYVNGYLFCNYALPGATLNGVSTAIQASTQPGSATNPYQYSGSIDLAGYIFDLRGSTGYQFNRIATTLLIKVAENAPSNALVMGQDSVVVELKFVNPVVEYAKGYFGQHEYLLQNQFSFSPSFQMPAGALRLEQAAMNISVRNAVGVDAQIRFNQIASINSTSSQSTQLGYAPLLDWVNITRATDLGYAVEANTYNFSIAPSNSQILGFIENLPDQLNIEARVKVNPLGNVSSGNDFIYTRDALSASMDLDIPLAVGMQNIKLSDTLQLTNDIIDLVANGHLILMVRNSFPFSAAIDLVLIDANGQLISTLLDDGVIEAALSTGSAGNTLATDSRILIPMTAGVIANISTPNQLVITARLNTPDFPQTHGIYEHYKLDYKLIANGNVEVSYE